MSAALVTAAASSGILHSGVAVAVVSLFGGLLVGVAVLTLVLPKRDVGSRIGTFINPSAPAVAEVSLIERALGDRSSSQKFERSPFLTRLGVELEVAGLALSVQALLAITFVLMLVVGYILYSSLSSPIGAALGVIVVPAVYFAVKFAANRQRRTFDYQLPDNLQVIASAMRAGQTFVGALATVVEDAPEPSRRELRRAVTDERLGVPFDEALGRVTERMHSEEFAHVTMVASLQRQAGGNTAEVIDLVCETVRERLEIVRMVRSLTAQGRLSGLMLSFLPVGLLIAISVIDPKYVHPLFHQTLGLIALGVSAVLVFLGGLSILKIITIEV